MNKSEALQKMVPPGMVRPSAYRGGIIQIHITRACDKACFGCTQGSNLGGKTTMISLELFEQAVMTLRDYFGVVGIFGGNPALHPKFSEICKILRKHIPFERRGLWCNHPKGQGPAMRLTFNPAVSNLNVHLDKEAYDEFKRDWPTCHPVGLLKESQHASGYVAMQDLDSLMFPDGSLRENTEENRWELISGCDINQKWSSMIGVFRGELRAWFCEIAGAQSILHQWDENYPDTGVPVVEGWWQKSMEEFSHQAEYHCHACGFPLRWVGNPATDENGIEQVSKTHSDIFKLKRPNRQVQFVTLGSSVTEKPLGSVVAYLQNSSR